MLSKKVELVDSEGGVTQLAYDKTNRLIQLITPASDSIVLSNDPAGRPVGITYPNGVASLVTFDGNTGRPSALTIMQGTTPLEAFAYGYDAAGKITEIAEDIRSKTYAYDDLQYLVAVQENGVSVEAIAMTTRGTVPPRICRPSM